ncbi:hypothetical protein E2L08_07385 [Palleronia sediminis]|uniref:Uncharacterized protein n=1 Tax=Palleronia sediminis TaxID=2547833 RepID=A0A4R6ABF0_9RHOB|nr:zeta toxin family protein [Palleronia sediminis]TDL81150.1 hypothetical protein E2L08_07385 [Palleronia sediminis]
MSDPATPHGPWHPGLKSQIPARLLPLSTLFRPEAATRTYAEVQELSDATGLPPFDLAAFRPERLVAHEILIRVTADLHIPDGPDYADLGVNLRGMVVAILEGHVRPEMASLVDAFDAFRARIADRLQAEVAPARDTSAAAEPPRPLLARLLRRPAPPPAPAPDPMADGLGRLEDWTARARRADDPIERACAAALAWAAGAILRTRGRLPADPGILTGLALARICNDEGSRVIGQALAPIFDRAARSLGYTVLPTQAEPVIMNVKGASAAGKSTLRALQRDLAERLGVPWDDFALISPDYWRKFLLDYGSLGDDYKYAAALTGHELAIIDQKLDRYMADKAESGQMTHLLIDRFRFDSFSAEKDRPADTRLLTRFGHRVYLFFVITPPEATVERAWIRGLDTGRYKAVDDLLHHNVEAFTGMPQLFFSWALARDREVHFEFLDNSVPKGSRPRTIASGWNGRMAIYDAGGMLNVDRFRKIEIDATCPSDVYLPGAEDPASNTGFLRACLERMDSLRFVDPADGTPWAIAERGTVVWRGDPPPDCPEAVRGLLDELGPEAGRGTPPEGGLDHRDELGSVVGRMV